MPNAFSARRVFVHVGRGRPYLSVSFHPFASSGSSASAAGLGWRSACHFANERSTSSFSRPAYFSPDPARILRQRRDDLLDQ